MSIVEFFDPKDTDHLEAWRHLSFYGVWPKGFIPDEVDFPPGWQTSLMLNMAHQWVEHKLGAQTT